MESRESSRGSSSFSTQQQTGLGGSGWEGKANQPNLPQVAEVIVLSVAITTTSNPCTSQSTSQIEIKSQQPHQVSPEALVPSNGTY